MDAVVDDNITILIAFATQEPQQDQKQNTKKKPKKKKYQQKVRKILINRIQAASPTTKKIDNNAIEVNG